MLRLIRSLMLIVVAGLGGMTLAAETRRPNVLMIPVDDLNHWVGHLGRNRQTKTPHLDRLAAMGVTFTNAHCAAPVCNPSRTALLSGRRPGSSGIYDNSQPFQSAISLNESLIEHFQQAGYETLGMGKLWHGGLGFPEQWSATGPKGGVAKATITDRSIGGIKFGPLNGNDDAVSDTRITEYGIAELAKTHDQPFFLVLGFQKPHMPWNVPQKYFDQHPLDQIELPPTQEHDLDDVPAGGIKMAGARGDHAQVVESGRWKEAIQAYLAAISYLDGQVGRVLDAYEKSPEKADTIICLWGDHGWHLGEKAHWRKFALWEEATRAPFIWVVPGLTQPGGVCHRPVDFMSVYPTLCELASLKRPSHVEGHSIARLLADPQSDWEHAAITTHGQNNHAIRTERWRYIRYADGGEELYDHASDQYEWTNLANAPAHAVEKSKLAALLPKVNQAPVKITTGEGADAPKKKAGQGRRPTSNPPKTKND